MTIQKNERQEQKDIKVYLGDKYYSFYTKDHKIRSWNLSALFFGMFWLAYRKRYLLVSIFICIDVLVSFLFRNHLLYWLVFAILMHFYIGKSGNLLYIAGTKKHIKQIRINYAHLQSKEINPILAKIGQPSWIPTFPLLIYFVVFHTYIFSYEIETIVKLFF